ncbi:MAG: sulfotransferase domain-containing protein [Arenibacterium sp.]
MFVIQYGMQGSASSWAFRLCRSILEAMGSDQDEILKTLDMGKWAWASIKDAPFGTPPTNVWDVKEAMNRLPEGKSFVLKTHSVLPDYLVPGLIDGKIKAIITTRDPFDAAVSIFDKGKKARENGTKQFAHVTSLEGALAISRGDVLKAARWRTMPKVLELPYKFIKAEPAACARLCAMHLGYDGPLDEILEQNAGQVRNFSKGLEGRGYEAFSEDQILELVGVGKSPPV